MNIPIDIRDLPEGFPLGDRYKVLRRLGTGGMGVVYLVRDERLKGELQAVKLLCGLGTEDRSAWEAFEQEAKLTRGLGVDASLHVAKPTDFGVINTATMAIPFFVMDYFEGRDLGNLVAEKGPLPLATVLAIARQLRVVLAAAHAKNIVHRDVKPENVFLVDAEEQQYVVKLLDFGIAKFLNERHSGTNSRVVGSPLFMAPEQWTKESRIGPATDIWAYALVVFYALTGGYYWNRDDGMQVFAEIFLRPRVRASERARQLGREIPPGLDDWFVRCLQTDPKDRYPSVKDCYGDLEKRLSPSILGSSFPPDRGTPVGATVEAPDENAEVDFAGTLRRGRFTSALQFTGLAALLAVGVTAAVRWSGRLLHANTSAQGSPSLRLPDVPPLKHLSTREPLPARLGALDGGRAGCPGEFADCIRGDNRSCETSVASDPNHCGGCGRRCDYEGDHVRRWACQNSSCRILGCDTEWQDLNKRTDDGCEYSVGTARQCGRSDVNCEAYHAVASCQAGHCSYECDSGWETCNSTENGSSNEDTDGCETHIASDPDHCGRCGNRCPDLPNATRGCYAGACTLNACLSGYGDCNGIAADGCEVSLLDNVSHCNRCGVQCPALQGAESSCRDGLCYGLCRDGQANCDGIMDNGCEADLETSVEHCGRCGARCRLNHAESTCAHGRCEFAYCQSNYGNCDGDTINGCETDLYNNRVHCGACGHACASVCRGGACESF